MLRKTTSLYVSECIINILQNGVQTNINHIDGLIEAYQNGREHGHIIFGLSTGLGEEYRENATAFYICQARRSDKICIYKGKYTMQGISEEAYSNPKYFPFGEYNEAAEWLAIELQTMLPKYTK